MPGSTALAIVQDMPSFRPPRRDPAAGFAALSKAVFDRLPIAHATPGTTPRDGLRLADESQTALGVVRAEAEKLFRAIVKAGFRVTPGVIGEAADRAREAAVDALVALLPPLTAYGIQPMPLAAASGADGGAIVTYYRKAAKRSAVATATDIATGFERLSHLMAVGVLERVGDDAARVLLYRNGPIERPPAGVSHPCFDAPGHISARLYELVQVREADFYRSYLRLPARINELLSAVPPFLRASVSGLRGLLVREGHGLVDPCDMSVSVQDGTAYDERSCLVLGNEYVLGMWSEAENTSLLARMFGI